MSAETSKISPTCAVSSLKRARKLDGGCHSDARGEQPCKQRTCQIVIYIDEIIRKHLKLKSCASFKKIKLSLPLQSESTANQESICDHVPKPRGVDWQALAAKKMPHQCADDIKIPSLLRDVIASQVPKLTANLAYALTYESHGANMNREVLKRSVEEIEGFKATLQYAIEHELPFLSLFVEPTTLFPSCQRLPSVAQEDQILSSDLPVPVPPPNPHTADSFTILSFYRFQEIADPHEMARQLEVIWKPLCVVGRIYLAIEGINAQMAVPSNVLEQFYMACNSLPYFANQYFNPDHTLSIEQFHQIQPFKNLSIRVRNQVLADGFAEPLDWSRCTGHEMPPEAWHQSLSGDNRAIVLDCRNGYESAVGAFEGAIPLNTMYFRDSWSALDRILQDTPKDAPIMTYCTGGIRCVKVNAYLEQVKGFTNVARLQGGIIAYTRSLVQSLDEENLDAPVPPVDGLNRNVQVSKFKGANYVFDGRMATNITSDVLCECDLCGSPSNRVVNCLNGKCKLLRLVQCETCRDKWKGCCSEECASVIM